MTRDPIGQAAVRLLRRLNNRTNAQIAGLHDGRDVFFLDINPSLMNADGSVSRASRCSRA